MPLTWDATKIKIYENDKDAIWQKYNVGTAEEYEDVNVELKSLIFGTMAVGIGNLKYTNAPDYYARWKIFEKYRHFSLYVWFEDDEKKEQLLTPEILKKYIGLSTNVSYESKKAWILRIVKSFANDKYTEDKPKVKELTKQYEQYVSEFENAF